MVVREHTATMRDRANDPLIDGIARIFEAVIGVSDATPEDTVASLGGDSLQVVNVIAEVERHYGVAIPDEFIAERPSIRSIADWLEGRSV